VENVEKHGCYLIANPFSDLYPVEKLWKKCPFFHRVFIRSQDFPKNNQLFQEFSSGFPQKTGAFPQAVNLSV
jgi:hypothetical protein